MKEGTRTFVNTLIFHWLTPQVVQDRISRNALLYIFYGAISTLVDWSVFYLIAIMLGFHYTIAATIAFIFSSTCNFVSNKYLNFQNESLALGKQYAVHFTISFSALLLTYLLLYVFIGMLGLPAMIAKMSTSALLAVYAYFAHKRFTFNTALF